MFPATLFDFNGVLVDDEHVHLAAFQDTLRPLGIELTEEAYWERYLGFDDAGAFAAILQDAGQNPSEQDVAALVAAKRPHYMSRAREGLRTFPGAAQLVAARAQVGPVAVVSGALRDEIEFGLSHLGVRRQVGRIVSAEDTTACKPDPEGYRIALAWVADQIGSAAAARTLVVEDSPAGIEAACAIGLPCVAVAHSYSRQELEKTPASAVVERIADITAEFLERLWNEIGR